MTDGTYHTHIDASTLSIAQRRALDDRLRSEAIQASWVGDRLQFDQAFEARVETLVADVRATTPNQPNPPGPVPGYPPVPGPAPAPYGAVGYPPVPYGAPGYGGFYRSPVTNSNAVLSLVLALCSFAVCGVCCIPAIILGRKAEREIAESQGMQTGEGLAKAGWIIGTIYAGLVGAVLLFLIVLFVAAAIAGASTR